MKSLLKLLTNIRFWLIVGFVLGTLLLIMVGYLFDWSQGIQILSIVVLFFILLLIFMFLSLRSARSTKHIEQSISPSPASFLAPDRKLEIEQFRQKMIGEIQSLKKGTVAAGKKGKSNLYSLPWYILFGPENSGKSTLVENSGLHFPMGLETGATQNCDWFYSNTSVLIDTAGTIIEPEDQDRAHGEWYELINLISKQRNRLPLNGAIVCVNLLKILDTTPDDVESLAKLLRSRVNDLIQSSGFHIPLYVIFTKCDLLEGFTEFFNQMPDDKINQIWGYTFSQTSLNDEEVEDLFSQEYDKLYDVLVNLRLANLSNPGDILKQSKIYSFPEKFYSAKEKINHFISHLFQQNFYAENPIFRGFYFTSSTQDQLSVNRASEEIEMQFNPETHVTQHRGPKINPRAYFTHKLFSELIIPEQSLVKPTPRMKLRFNFKNIVLGFITVVVLILFIFNIIMSAARNRDDIIALNSMIHVVDQVDWEQKAEPAHFEILYQIQSFTTHLQDAPFLSGSIYQGDRLIKPANQIFIKKFVPLMSNFLYRDVLSKYLHSYLNKTATVKRDQAYEYLRAYLLLDIEINRLSDEEAEKEFLKSLMTTLVDSIFNQKFNKAYQNIFNEQNITSLHTLLQKEVTYFVDVLTYEDIENLDLPFKNDKRLVDRVRKALGKPDISDVYARIKREGMVKYKQITINKLLSQYGEDYFEDNTSVSEFFSKTAWNNYISDKIDEVSKNPNRDDWVLNVQASELPAEFQDATIMKQKLRQRYFYEYGKAWWKFLGNIRYLPFEDEKGASRQLIGLGDFIESPIRKLIDIVTDQTRFEGVIDQKAVEIKKELGLAARRHSIDDQFRFVHALSEDEGGKLGDLLSHYEILSSVMEKMQEDPGENSAKMAADVIQQGSGDIPDALQSIRRSLRRLDQNARISVFEKPVTMTWSVLLAKVQQYLNQQWAENVNQIFDSEIADTYPINKKSNTEIPPVDLARFFKKNDGILWNFVDIELKPFLRKNSWNPDTWEGEGILLSQDYKSSLQKANDITEGLGLLTRDDIKLDFKILPQLPASKIGSVEQIILFIDGQELVYRMGRPTWENFFWPNPESVGSARLEVRTRITTYRPQQFDGSWSWFRLLDQAVIKKSTAAEINAEWRFPPDQNYEIQVKFKISAHTINNPFGQKSFFKISFPASLSE